MKEALFSIGEVSKLANISIKALRYYDKIDLFKPAYVDPETNYRYYKDSQLNHLDLIKSLKYIGTSLEDIKKAQELGMNDLFVFLTEQEEKIRQKVESLLEIEQTLSTVKKRMKRQMEYPALHEVFVADEVETRIIQTKVDDLDPYTLYNASYSKLKHFTESTDGFMNSSYGATYTFQPYTQIEQIKYKSIFTPLLTNKQISTSSDVEVTTIPSGRYACIAFIFSIEDYFMNLQKLITYVSKPTINVISNFYEIFIPNHYSPNKQEEFMVEIKVQIKG
jgi:MerR family transcriptional regulator, activator of bmr gene